jgi:hypothetical protein
MMNYMDNEHVLLPVKVTRHVKNGFEILEELVSD